MRLEASLFAGLFLVMASAAQACTDAPFYVSGISLQPLVADGSTVNGHLGTDCPDPARADLLLFRHLGFRNPLIKIVVGLPGDHFALKRDGEDWLLAINGKPTLNAEGIPYRLNKSRADMIALYVKGARGVVPPDNWLVMGDNPAGTDDSSRLGLIPRDAVLGTAVHPGS